MDLINHSTNFPNEDFSDYEQVYLQMSRAFSHLDKEHWGIYCICSIHYDTPNEKDIGATIRDAWMRLMVEYPGLSMVPVGLEKHYPQLDEAGMLSWAQNTFFITSNLSANDVIAAAKPRDLPSLHYLPTSSEIVLIIQHWRADGLGSCMLLDRLFEIMAVTASDSSPPVQMRQNRPSPSLESVARVLKTDGEEHAESLELKEYARNYIDAFHKKAVNAGGLPYRGSATALPGRPTHHALTFTATDTQAITTACARERISVSAAIHAALARTVFSYLSEEECEMGYTTVMAVNMRPWLTAPYNSRDHACQTYVASITPTVPYKHGSLVDTARALTAEYRGWWSERFMRSLRWIYQFHLARLSAGPPPAKLPSGVTLSSLGVVERHLRGDYGSGLRVERFQFGVSMMTRQTILYAWTFRGQLTLSLNYNETYYSESMAREVVSQVASQLEEGLEIKS